MGRPNALNSTKETFSVQTFIGSGLRIPAVVSFLPYSAPFHRDVPFLLRLLGQNRPNLLWFGISWTSIVRASIHDAWFKHKHGHYSGVDFCDIDCFGLK